MHLTGNAQQGSSVICNCCPCCCGVLRAITELNIPRSVARTNFSPRVDQQECTLCMKCVETCPTDAITELPPGKTNTSNTKLVVQESQCIGCGLCAQHCPLAIIRMVKVRDDLPAPTVPEMMKRYQEQKRYECGKNHKNVRRSIDGF